MTTTQQKSVLLSRSSGEREAMPIVSEHGRFAVTRVMPGPRDHTDHGEFVAVHVATGAAVVIGVKRGAAEQAATALDAVGDVWDVPDGHPPSVQALVYAIRRAVEERDLGGEVRRIIRDACPCGDGEAHA